MSWDLQKGFALDLTFIQSCSDGAGECASLLVAAGEQARLGGYSFYAARDFFGFSNQRSVAWCFNFPDPAEYEIG